MINFEPSEDQELIVETVRQFAENEIRPRARECDESGELPQDVLNQAHELGLVANSLPESCGGGGERSAVTGCLVAEELAWGDLSIAIGILSPTLAGLPVVDAGSRPQQDSVLATLCGPAFVPGSLAISEPDFDFDVYRPRTTASREGDEYLLNGLKCQVPSPAAGQPFLVTALVGDQLEAFFVAPDAAGLKRTRESNLGIRALATEEITFDAVRVPAADRLGADLGADVRAIVTRGRVAMAAMAVGVARAAFEVATEYAKQRETFGAPIATRQAIAFKIADMAIEIDGVRLLTWEAAWNLDQGKDALREANLAYQQAEKVVLQVADGAVQIFGGHGYIRDYLPEMHLRNASGFSSFEALSLV
ncbi:MAG: acyl-CoA dehydrogenase [Myxococcota bacterium]|jgi:acyl-CoA dehydrogenase